MQKTAQQPGGTASATPAFQMETQADGSILIWQEGDLPSPPVRITERMLAWAEQIPDQTWIAERDANGDWRRVSYAEGVQSIQSIGTALLAHGLSVDRPLLILSGNSISHALMAMGAQHVGIPSAAISPAYSLASDDASKLAAIAEQLTPGLIFVDRAAPFASAINRVFATDVGVISENGRVEGRETIAFDDLLNTLPGEAVKLAHAAITPETVAKFLFTSGTTGSPKAVTQTHGMLCANQEMVRAAYAFLQTEPPVIVDWAPWNHTAAGNKVFNMAHYNGGTYYIDDGRPTPAAIGKTLRNLREVAPNWYFNVPIGYQFLLDAMETDTALTKKFFSQLKMMMYAGAGMSQAVWDRLTKLAAEQIPGGVPIISGLGATETGPFALYYSEKKEKPGNIGFPALGVVLKLVPQDDKLEARLKSPSITPGYWRNAKLTTEAFDEDGFYILGDALRFAVPGDPSQGFIFDGRLAENFKLATGTWVAVGALRAALVNALDGLASDAVIVGENHDDLRALLVPNWTELRLLSNHEEPEDILRDPAVVEALRARLTAHATAATGSASRVVAAAFITTPLRFDLGEVTDKGSVNQRAVLRARAIDVAALWNGGPGVVQVEWKGKR